jgi:hypothetical protein
MFIIQNIVWEKVDEWLSAYGYRPSTFSRQREVAGFGQIAEIFDVAILL